MLLRPSSIVLILANLVPLGGVLLLDWQVFDIMMLYWAENVVIGVLNVMRMAVTSGGSKWFSMLFFSVHYGLFCFAHVSAITALFGDTAGIATASQYFFGTQLTDAWKTPLWIGIVAIFASHLFSYFSNFIGAGEYRRTSARRLMHRPYGRIIALHLAVIIGAFLVEMLDSPVMMLIVLIAVKILVDLRLHATERDKLGGDAITT